jgi:3-hydroxyacyl-[acyl-carrier-protein] dehydratase
VKFVDQISIDAAARSAEGSLFVDAGADYLRDHFPGMPILPGLLMLEASVRTAAALWAAGEAPPADGAVLAALDRLQVVRRVVPGETLRVRVERVAESGARGMASFTARGAVDGATAVRASFRLRAACEEVTE